MQIRLSSKGHVVLPAPIRRKLGLGPGDPLDAGVKGGQIILTPKASIRRDPVTGLPVLSAGSGDPHLTSEQVQDILSNRPKHPACPRDTVFSR